jgi:copper(I)-binding protein
MRPLADGVEIAPGETVTLKPGGLHIMLMKLTGPIKKGDAVPITLTFEKAGEITLQFIAAPIGAKAPPAH